MNLVSVEKDWVSIAYKVPYWPRFLDLIRNQVVVVAGNCEVSLRSKL